MIVNWKAIAVLALVLGTLVALVMLKSDVALTIAALVAPLVMALQNAILRKPGDRATDSTPAAVAEDTSPKKEE